MNPGVNKAMSMICILKVIIHTHLHIDVQVTVTAETLTHHMP